MGWYAIFVETGKEEAVSKRINRELSQTVLDGQFTILIPKRRMVERRNGICEEVEYKLFPGYILVKTEYINELYHLTFRLEHLYRYLRCSGVFDEIRLEEISNIVYMANEEGVIGLSNIVIDNDTVKVIDGSLRNYKGFVVKIDKHKGRARVLFKFNGQDHLIDLSVNILKTISDENIRNEIRFWRTQNSLV